VLLAGERFYAKMRMPPSTPKRYKTVDKPVEKLEKSRFLKGFSLFGPVENFPIKAEVLQFSGISGKSDLFRKNIFTKDEKYVIILKVL